MNRRQTLLALTLATLVLAVGCGSGDDSPGGTDGAPLWAFRFGDAHGLALFDGGGVLLATDSGVRRLMPVPGDAGNRYAGPRDTLLATGGEGTLSRDGDQPLPCRTTGRQKVLTGAWRAGVVFLAGGNEPSWNLRATAERLVLQRPDAPPLELQLRAPLRRGTARFTAGMGAGELSVRLEPGPWLDTMSGEPFPLTVNMTLEGKVYRGGGLYFPPAPQAEYVP